MHKKFIWTYDTKYDIIIFGLKNHNTISRLKALSGSKCSFNVNKK